jgi:transposase
MNREKNDWQGIKRLSIDEISLRKGHQAFVTVVSDIDHSELLEVIDSHKSEEVIAALEQQPLEVRAKVSEVSIDMWGGFPKVIQQVFPNAVIVYDRFHVMKLVNQELNQLRKVFGVTTKGSKYLLLKNGIELDEEQQQKLEAILSQSVCLRIAYELKEECRQIYETSRGAESGRRRFQRWLHQAQVFYCNAARTIRTHLDGICNYFISHTTSGVMEGMNNRIKLIMRQAYGFTNFENFRNRLLACFSD